MISAVATFTIINHATSSSIECKCDQCDKPFETAVELNQHLMLEHMREETLSCDRCQTKWTSTLGEFLGSIPLKIQFPVDLKPL